MVFRIFLCLLTFFALPVASFAQDQGGFKIATPPLGYPDYNVENAATNRINFSYLRYDSEDFDLHGGSVNTHSRLKDGEWGGFSLEYGAFVVAGTESNAVMRWTGFEWVSDGDTRLLVAGANLEPVFEWQAINRHSAKGWGFRLIPFFGPDTGFQVFKQSFRDDAYWSLILGASGGVQMHIHFPGRFIVSPFAQAAYMHVMSFDSGVEHFNNLMLSYGFDIIWRQYSLSGVLQPLMGDTGMFTITLGFAF